MYAITVFGDSITFGRGNNVDRGWCGRLRKEFEQKDFFNALYNLGIPGETSTRLLERIETECKARLKKIRESDKNIIIIAIGLNDSRYIDMNKTPQTSKEKFNDNFSNIIKIAKQYGDRVVVINLNPVDEDIAKDFEGTQFFNERINEFNSIIEENCKTENLELIDVFSLLKKENLKEILCDGLHPNSKGYEVMYEHISSKLNL